MKYYYVVFGSEHDYYLACYNDIIEYENGEYIYKPIMSDSKIMNILYKLHLSSKINNIITIPRKDIWNSKLVDIKKDEPICFVFLTNTRRFESLNYGFLDYLKMTYKQSKFVCFYQDIVSLKRPVNVDRVKQMFDLVISFDQFDCEKYGLTYYPDVYSYNSINPGPITNDVYFVGRAKDRLDEILNVYSKLRDSGLRSDFHIVGVDYKDQKYKDEIDYCNIVPYRSVVESVCKSKAILELMQSGANGYTLRTCEAITYDKMLITNNQEILKAPFYSSDNIIYFEKSNEIDASLIMNAEPPFDYNYKNNLSPINFLQFIDDILP